MELVEDKNKRSGLIGTIVVHVLMLLVFIFYGMTYLEPPPPEEGITINFGTSDDGMGEQQPVEPVSSNQETVPDQPTEETVSAPTESSQEMLTQTIEEAPTVVKKKKVMEKKVETPKEEPKPSAELAKANSQWKNKSKAQQSNEGETGKPGDQGSLEGDPNSGSRVGGPSGSGITFNLAGRKMIGVPKIVDNSQEEGKVVVDIVVDQSGNVVRAIPGGRGSTTTSPVLYRKAKEAAMRAVFSIKSDAAIEQKGQMTFIFILN
jgi:protein TonB